MATADPEPGIPDADAEQAAIAGLRAAREMAVAGNRVGAVAAYERIGQEVPALRGWTDMLTAMAAAQARDTAQVRQRLAQSPDSLLVREWGWRVLVRALEDAGDAGGAYRTAAAAARAAESATRRAAAWRAAGDRAVDAGDSARALDAYRNALVEDPGSPAALEVARTLVGWKLVGDDARRAGEVLLRHGGAERAARLLNGHLAATGFTPEVAELRLRLGDALMHARRYADAEPHLLAAAASLPRAEVLAGRLHYRQGRLSQARQAFRAVADRAPGSEEAAEALYLLGDLAHDAGARDSARAHYRRSVATGVESEGALLSILRLTSMAVAAGDAATASRDVALYLETRTRPELRAPALYWAGRAAALSGDRAAAEQAYRHASELDPVSYYGVRALEQLGRGLHTVAIPAGPGISASSAGATGLALFRARVLRALDLREEAAFEIAQARVAAPPGSEALYLVAEEMLRSGQPAAAAILGREIARQRGAWDRRLLAIVYPFPVREAVEREARRNGQSPFLVAGLIRQESLFNPIAVSPAGAVGLMQVMPETGRSLARRAGIAGFTPAMLRDPDVNLRLGSRFLADQVRRYANLTEVFAAYNAGPGRVSAWRAFPERADEDAFVERIPFAETRDYVKRLRLNRHVYELLYGTESGATAR